MKSGYTHFSLLLDASSSMGMIQDSIINSFNEYIEEQKKNPGEATVTLAKFSSTGTFQYISEMDNLQEIPKLSRGNYNVGGMTALNESLYKLINETGEKLAAMKEEDRPEGVMVIVISDGEENQSRGVTPQMLKAAIEHQEQKYNWKFIYIGANQDSSAASRSRGMTDSLNFVATGAGVDSMFKKMSLSNTMYRSNTSSLEYKSALVDDEPQKEQQDGKFDIFNRALQTFNSPNVKVTITDGTNVTIKRDILDPDTGEVIGSQG